MNKRAGLGTGDSGRGRAASRVTGVATCVVIVMVAFIAGCSNKDAAPSAASTNVVQSADGIVVTPASGPAKRVRLQVMSDRIIHVTAAPGVSAELPPSLMVTAKVPVAGHFTVEQQPDKVLVKTPQLTASVALDTGGVSFVDAKGNPTLAEHDRAPFDPVLLGGEQYYAVRQQFNPGTDEAFYGLGQHQNAQMNYNGEDVQLAQHNMDVGVPFVMSSRNYGVLWDNNSITRFGDPQPYGLASRDLKITDADGKEGGFTASYFVSGKLKLKRAEKDINYQYIKDLANRPEAMLGANVSNTSAQRVDIADETVVWEGNVESATTGVHRFKLYVGSYFKLFADDKKLLDGWRQNWNAWYHNVDIEMTAGKPVHLRIEWTPNDSQIALLHNNPLPKDDRHSLWLSSEAAHAIDYYYVQGDNPDEVISGYRQLTGKAVLLPRWVYGFWQSRQRYETQDQLVGVVREYRKRQIPLDNIVQDWFYWPEAEWGSHKFDPKRYPHPQAMVDDVHKLNAHVMISVWPKFYPTTDNYKELDAKGFMYKRNVEVGAHDWVGKGYENSFYDPYSPEARKVYWRQIQEKLNVLGMDAWWLDASEPDIHSNLDPDEIKRRIGPTALGSSTAFFNSYPLLHSTGVYEGSRSVDPDKRVFILTRSSFAGQQRTAAATWSGDVASRWDDLHNQISAGVNFSMSGLPNWSFDIGGFALESRYLKPTAKDLDEWRELNLRWFEFGAFVPLFRSHGEPPFREIYNIAPPNSEMYRAMVAYDELRYRLLPYIYASAAATYHNDSTLMRGLPMDFPQDARVRNLNDEYLFGHAFLVSPVYEYQARKRKVYLPAGTRWYNFYTGEASDGGASLDVDAPPGQMPLFVRAGAIVPMGPVMQYSSEKPDAPVTLYVYQGASDKFDLYEDDGVTYGYENGEFSNIPLSYDDATKTLTIGARTGSFKGMIDKRTFNVRWIVPGDKHAADFAHAPDSTVEYTGVSMTVTSAQH
jgi:alpha-D-xyloside xylohydrolase